MSDTVRNHTGGIVLSFLAGAATGAAVALLTAPQSGRDTRRKLKHFTEDLAERATRVPPALQEAYRRATEAGKEAFVRTLEQPADPVPAPSTIHSRQH
jgi:gas vesicle protein